jgi:hypothetical protein
VLSAEQDGERLRARLTAALAATRRPSATRRVVVSLPSHSMPQRLLDHHASHLARLEHRALLDGLRVAHDPGADVVVVTHVPPPAAVLDYYARLALPHAPEDARRRVHCLVVPDDAARGIAAKLLDRPDLLERLAHLVGDAPAVVEPWNVTADEEAVALALGAPLNGGPAALWPHGFKGASRRLFRRAGVPVPAGVEDVHDAAEVAAAVDVIRRDRPSLDHVVVKLDNSGAAEGNWMMPTRGDDGRALGAHELAELVSARAPGWFLADLSAGGVVEELVAGDVVTSPSVQLEIAPEGDVTVLATHEQVLGGDSGQVFLGSRFPADDAYATVLADHAASVGRVLAGLGAVGWVSVDFVARRHGDAWDLAAVDLNLRKGGTTHSLTALEHLVPGGYDVAANAWTARLDGAARCYRSSDAVVVPGGPGLDAASVVAAVSAAGLELDPARGVGVVLHMFPSLVREGTVGATAVGRSADEAERLFAAVPAALAGA